MPLNTGQILRERYRIEQLLGKGGFGVVYRAWDTTFELPCAVKENSETSSEAQRQFLREARLLHTLRHPNLPLVKDYFVIEGQGQYLVMDFVEGEDLQEKLDAAGGPLPETQAVAWVLQVCGALEYLHAQNPPVIHRDIKPANIKITPEGRAVLVDFGISKQSDPGRPTTKGAQVATPGYAPFEQYGQAPTDARSDIYSLGATLYHLLTGKIPVESISRMRGVTLENPHTLNPSLSQQVERAILQAMALQPEGRYRSAEALGANLRIPPTEKVILDQPGGTVFYIQTPVPTPKPAGWAWLRLIGGIAALVLMAGITIGLFNWISGRFRERSASLTATARSALTQAAQASLTEISLLASTTASETPLDATNPARQTATGLLASNTTVESSPEGMVLIHAGEFQMGSESGNTNERPVHTVYLDDFYIDKYEVTNAQYAMCVAAGNCRAPQVTTYYDNPDYAQHPVGYVDWSQSQAYCRWRGGDLPNEAQWEKAARGGLQGKLYPWGDEAPMCTPGVENGAQFYGCGGQAVAVGSFRPNGYGLYDMAGNVWEWVLDWYLDTFYASSPLENPSGQATGNYRVLRGGSWYFDEHSLRVAYRTSLAPDLKDIDYGFRCSRSSEN